MKIARSTWVGAGIIALACVAALAAGGIAVRDGAPEPAHAAPLAADPPGNDNWLQRWPLTPPMSPPGAASLPYDGAQSTAGATLEPGEGAPCASVHGSVWYELYADTNGTVEIDTAGSDYDTVLAVYQPGTEFVPSPPGGGLTAVTCNDDSGGAQSRVSFAMTAYTSYFIQVGARVGGGTLRIHAACNPACPPSNDNQQAAAYAWVDAYNPHFTMTVDTRGATLEPDEPRPCAGIGNTVWFQFYADHDGAFDISTAGSDFNTVLAAYTFMDPFTLPSPPGGIENIACEYHAAGAAAMTLPVTAGKQYWIQAGGAGGASGTLRFDLTCHGPCPPYNDRFGYTGFPSPPFVDSFDTSGATLEQGEPTSCGDMGKTVWWGIMVEGKTRVSIDNFGSDFPVAIAVYDDPSMSFSLDGVHRLACETGGARLEFDASPGTNYYLQVGGEHGASGNLSIGVGCTPGPCPPYGDSIVTAYYANVPWSYPFIDYKDTRGATVEDGESTSCGNMGRTVWYGLQSSGDVRMVYDTAGSDFDTAIAVYRGDVFQDGVQGGAFTGLTPVACFPGGASQRARAEFDLPANAQMWVQVGGRDGAAGDLQVQADCFGTCPPANDAISAATWVYAPYTESIRTGGATVEASEPLPCGTVGKTAWYYVPAQGATSFTAWTMDATFPAVIAVYEQTAISPPGGMEEVDCQVAAQGVATVRWDAKPRAGYLVQVGGVDGAGGDVLFQLSCAGCMYGQGGGGPMPPVPGGIAGPDTGSGGYLPGSRR